MRTSLKSNYRIPFVVLQGKLIPLIRSSGRRTIAISYCPMPMIRCFNGELMDSRQRLFAGGEMNLFIPPPPLSLVSPIQVHHRLMSPCRRKSRSSGWAENGIANRIVSYLHLLQIRSQMLLLLSGAPNNRLDNRIICSDGGFRSIFSTSFSSSCS